MINPASLRLRVKSYYRGRSIKAHLPSLPACEAVIHIVAQVTNLTADELCRKIERSDITITPLTPDHRQMALFPEPILLGPLDLNPNATPQQIIDAFMANPLGEINADDVARAREQL